MRIVGTDKVTSGPALVQADNVGLDVFHDVADVQVTRWRRAGGGDEEDPVPGWTCGLDLSALTEPAFYRDRPPVYSR